jgi:SAM-dependent methyltransferase
VPGFSLSTFQKYAAWYDLLYYDKDYAAEAAYIVLMIGRGFANVHTILEFGSGTGHHGRLLAAKGSDVYGIDRSFEMVCKVSLAAAANGRKL